MKIGKTIVVMLFSLSISFITQGAIAAACVQENNIVGFVGLDSSDKDLNNNLIYPNIIATVSGHNNGCGCNNIIFFSANSDTKSALSILLSAKMSNMPVRIDLLDSADCNSAYRVYLH